jgi:hypothetical protein
MNAQRIINYIYKDEKTKSFLKGMHKNIWVILVNLENSPHNYMIVKFKATSVFLKFQTDGKPRFTDKAVNKYLYKHRSIQKFHTCIFFLFSAASLIALLARIRLIINITSVLERLSNNAHNSSKLFGASIK